MDQHNQDVQEITTLTEAYASMHWLEWSTVRLLQSQCQTAVMIFSLIVL